MSNTCPQCAIFSEAINQLVASAKKEREEDSMEHLRDEVKLLNLKSYARLVGSALDRSSAGSSYNLPADWRVISGATWDDIHVMLYHIEETLAALLPQEDAL